MASAKGYNQLEGCNLNKLDDWNRLEDLLEQVLWAAGAWDGGMGQGVMDMSPETYLLTKP